MRESIGSALLLNIVLVLVGCISLFLVGSIAYSKAYKVKNRIINIIEKYDGDCFGYLEPGSNREKCYNEIENELSNMGYSSNISKECPMDYENNIDNPYKISLEYPVSAYEVGHKYCVYKYTMCELVNTESGVSCTYDSEKRYYYKVVTFMHFDIPLIGQFLEFSVSGETKQFYDTYVNFVDEIEG